MSENDLFAPPAEGEPLAARMRPRTLDEFVGQDHILGPGRLLRRAIQADRLSSVIFAGPPGTGKTTLARVIANTTRSSFLSLNAVLSGVKDVREAIEKARRDRGLYDRRTILFVDEVHRWNKAQQDALLPWVENGTIVLIGATTANPFFEVNSALVSRSRIFQLRPLGNDDLRRIARMTLEDRVRGYGCFKILVDEDALDHLVASAEGDARNLLGALELAVETSVPVFPPPAGTIIHIDRRTAEDSIQKKVVLYDKEGDYHYDAISAFIKSIRGSDPDAALFWLARMVHAGEDPRFIFRRLLIAAGEDIGMADPQALVVVEAAAAAFERVGMPEGQFHLAQAVLYCATAPKSNSGLAFFDALKAVEEESADVPAHLKDGSRDKAGFGHGQGYLYPHAYRDHWVAQNYLPKGLQGRIFYRPSRQGYEAGIAELVSRRREAQMEAALLPEQEEEILTYSPESLGRWVDRVEAAASSAGRRSGTLADFIRTEVFADLPIRRHDRVLAIDRAPGVLVFEALRRAPEGGVWALFPDKRELEFAEALFRAAQTPDVPALSFGMLADFDPGDVRYEILLGRAFLAASAAKDALLRRACELLVAGGRFSAAEPLARRSMRLSELEPFAELPADIRAAVLEAEAEIYGNPDDPFMNWEAADLEAAAIRAGFTGATTREKTIDEIRLIRPDDVAAWLAGGKRGYSLALPPRLSSEQRSRFERWCAERLAGNRFPWRTSYVFLDAFRT